MYNDNIIVQKIEAIHKIPDYMIPVNSCQKKKYLITFTNDEMVSKFEALAKKNWMHYI